MEGAGFLVYVLVKAAAYIGWCGYGARLHGHRDRLLWKAVGFGLLRMFMGLAFGLGLIFFLVNAFTSATRVQPLLYLLVYVPVRWLEWSAMAILMDRNDRTLWNFQVGRTTRSRLWRLGGIAISCLADIPMMVSMNGLPIGRFMC